MWQNKGFQRIATITALIFKKASNFLETPWAGLLLVFFVFFSQWNSIVSPWISIADLRHGMGCPGVGSWSNLKHLFSSDYTRVFWEGSYHPLATFFYFVNRALFGPDPQGYRIIETLFLAGIVLLIWKLGRRHLGQWAWFAALIYTLHPFNSTTAFPLLDVRDELTTLLCLMAVASHRWGADRNHGLAPSILTAGIFFLALLAKETAIVIPGILLLDDFAGGISGKHSRRRWLFSYLYIAGAMFFYLLFLAVVMRGEEIAASSFIGYAGANPVFFALSRFNLFINMLFGNYYGPAWYWLVPASLILLVFAVAREWKVSISFLFWVILGILPVSGLIPIRSLSEFISKTGLQKTDHYLILPGVGFVWLMMLAMRRIINGRAWFLAVIPAGLGVFLIVHPGNNILGKEVGPEVLKCIPDAVSSGDESNCNPNMVAIFLSESSVRVRYPTLFQEYETVVNSDKSGILTAFRDFLKNGITDPCRSASVISGVVETHSYGSLYKIIKEDRRRAFRKGCDEARAGLPDADEYFNRAKVDDPAYAETHKQSAMLQWRRGNRKEAVINYLRYKLLAEKDSYIVLNCYCAAGDRQIEKAIVDSIRESARLRAESGKSVNGKGSIEKLDEAIRFNPADMEVFYSRGTAKDSMGDPDGAIQDFSAAAGIAGEEADWLKEMARNQALTQSDIGFRSMQLYDFSARMLTCRAKSLLKVGRIDEAVQDLRTAMRISSEKWEGRRETEKLLSTIPLRK